MDELRELFADVGVLGVVREVLELVGVGLHVEEHGAAFALVEFGVAPAVGADGGAGESFAVLAPDAEGGVVPLAGGVFQEWDEGAALLVGRGREAGEFDEGGVDVECFDDAFAGGAVGGISGGIDDQRDAVAFFKEGAGLGPFAFFAELVAVVDGEDDDGFVAQAEAIECGEDDADVVVDPGDGSEVGLDDFFGFFGGGVAIDEEVGVFGADGVRGEAFGDGGARGEIDGELDGVEGVEVVELLRGGGRGVGFGEAAGDEEGPVFVLFECGDGELDVFVFDLVVANVRDDEGAVRVFMASMGGRPLVGRVVAPAASAASEGRSGSSLSTPRLSAPSSQEGVSSMPPWKIFPWRTVM